jgi:riboflavin kinase/FMN adenylyltransferase
MKVMRGFDRNAFDSTWESVVTIGGFDGIHVGHAAILEHLCDRARSGGGKGIVITFDPLPREFFKKDAFKVITTVEEKLEILEAIGVDGVWIIPFTEKFSQLDALVFLEKVWEYLHPFGIIVGHNHHFGRDGKGGISILRTFSQKKGIDLIIVKEVKSRDEIVSSTRIRRLIAQGEIKGANMMLGRAFSFCATVTKGEGIGKALSYPTANLAAVSGKKILPKDGVYAAKVGMNGGEYGAMLYFGRRPTFGSGGRSGIEAHLMGFKGDLYGRGLLVKVIEKIREERKFSSPKNLRHQIMNDEAVAKKIIKSMAAKQGG